MRHARLRTFACAALAASAAAAASASPALALGGQRPERPAPATAAGGERPPAEPPAPPPLPPGPEWRESVTHAIPRDAVAACLRAAGPGRLTLFGGETGGRSTIELWNVGDDGLSAGPATHFGRLAGCPETAAADAADAPLLAASTVVGSGRRAQLVRQVAIVGGRPQPLFRSRGGSTPTLATAPGGAAAIAWSEQPPGDAHSQLLVATRAPGATRFGRPRIVATRIDDWESPALAVDRRGRAHVAWVEKPRRENGASLLHVAGSDPAGRFGRAQRLGATWGFLGPSSLAVAPNGRALLVDPSTGYGRAWEMQPGGRRFAPVPLPDIAAEQPVVALTDDGAAVLAYRDDEGVSVLRRPAGGRFGARQDLPSAVEEKPTGVQLFGVGGSKAPSDPRATELRVALSPAGEIVVAWTTAAAGGAPGAAQVAHGTLAAGMSAPRQLGGSCRAASATTPLQLADGRLAVAWSDNARTAIVADVDWPIGGGQVHVALPAAPGSAPPVPAARPRVSASVVGDGRIESGQALRLRVDCGGLPCDVRASAQARRVGPRGIWPLAGPLTSATTTSVAAGGSAELELEPLARTAFAPPEQERDVPIELSVCTAGGPVAERTTVRARLRGAPLPPAPRIVALRAERRERRVVVTWRTTAAPERRSLFYVVGTAPPIADRPGSESVGQASFVVRGARRRFRAVIEPEEGRLPRDVVVILSTAKVDNAAEARVRVR